MPLSEYLHKYLYKTLCKKIYKYLYKKYIKLYRKNCINSFKNIYGNWNLTKNGNEKIRAFEKKGTLCP